MANSSKSNLGSHNVLFMPVCDRLKDCWDFVDTFLSAFSSRREEDWGLEKINPFWCWLLCLHLKVKKQGRLIKMEECGESGTQAIEAIAETLFPYVNPCLFCVYLSTFLEREQLMCAGAALAKLRQPLEHAKMLLQLQPDGHLQPDQRRHRVLGVSRAGSPPCERHCNRFWKLLALTCVTFCLFTA